MPHHSSTDFPVICSSLPLLNADPYGPPMTETLDTDATLPSLQCACVNYHLHSMTQQCNLAQDPSKRDRFDQGMQAINNVWTTSRAILQCENDHHHPQLFFCMLWSIRLACSWFQSRSSTKQQETPASRESPNINGIDFRCGEYAISREQLHVMHYSDTNSPGKVMLCLVIDTLTKHIWDISGRLFASTYQKI